MRRSFVSFVSLLVFLSALIPSARAQATPQEEPGGSSISTRTDLVLVPVVVTDKSGKHLSKLNKDDFRLEEDGKTQGISRFEEITASATPMRHAAAPLPNAFTNEVLGDPSSRVLVIIALDFLNTTFADEVFARRALLKYLAESVHENTLVSFVNIDGTGMHLIHDFTTDPSVLMAALKRVSGGTPRLDTNEQDAMGQGVAAQERATILAETAGLSNLVNPDFIRAAAQAAIINGQVAASRESMAIRTTLEALQHLAQSYASVPGRKALIWATGSFPFVMHDPGDLIGGISPEMYQRTFQMLGNANIAVYPVDVRGLAPGVVSPHDANRPVQLSNNIAARAQVLRSAEVQNAESVREDTLATLRSFADMTGGRAFYNANDLA